MSFRERTKNMVMQIVSDEVRRKAAESLRSVGVLDGQ